MAYLLAKDTVTGAEGSVVVTKEGRNYVVAGMRNITTNAEIQSSDMRVIGTRTIQDKPNGAKLTGTGNIYYGTNLWTDMVLQYIHTGVMPEFDIQITNSDSASATLGSQVMAYYGCHLTGTVPLSVLNSEETMLNYDFNFAYTRVARLQAFNDPAQLGNYVASELQRRITEALKMDDRVRGISGFTYAVEGDMLRASLTVSTVYGEMQTSVEVDIT